MDESLTDAANPRKNNKDGHVIEITERGNRGDATTFDWNLLLVCGDPADPTGARRTSAATRPRSRRSPARTTSPSTPTAHLWIATDGQPSSINKADGLFKVGLTGANRGKVEQFLAVPREAETCGPVIHDRDGSVFVAVQHPGEDGTWAAQTSFFPDYVAAGSSPSAATGGVRGPPSSR